MFERGSIAALFIAIGAVGWLTMARIVRGQTLSLRRREFIDAAIASGVRRRRSSGGTSCPMSRGR